MSEDAVIKALDVVEEFLARLDEIIPLVAGADGHSALEQQVLDYFSGPGAGIGFVELDLVVDLCRRDGFGLATVVLQDVGDFVDGFCIYWRLHARRNYRVNTQERSVGGVKVKCEALPAEDSLKFTTRHRSKVVQIGSPG